MRCSVDSYIHKSVHQTVDPLDNSVPVTAAYMYIIMYIISVGVDSYPGLSSAHSMRQDYEPTDK